MPNISTKRLLVIDDNKSIRSMIREYMVERGYEVLEASDGIQGLDKAISTSPGVIILDVMMPGIDGLRLCQMLRQRGMSTPIIMLTERASLDDKVAGYSRGIDDYLAKPFSPLELELRIGALLRRGKGEGEATRRRISIGGLEIDLDRHAVVVDGREVSLTPIEFNVLKLLASTPGYVFSRQDLLSVIWDTAYPGYKRNIDPHVNRLRGKIESNPKKPKYVLTVWGVGYKFNETLQ